MSAHQYDEGHTVAGWTGFGIASVGSVVLGVGVCTVSAAFLAVGLAIGVVSVLVTWALHLAGWGKPPGRRPREQWGMRERDLAARQGHPGCVGCRLAGRGPRTAEVPTHVPVVGEPEPAAAADSVG
ncbi:HGxxPAAW family protein [Streptomyces sp. GESEQ-35]|uniref:HGxxPAAW family protein n=1 Tax=Streptomyces sp. GESEQ-35 TaxID=2812657 RepID=UPI001B31BD71|nr:HGxxPAAW family protein [Streptomyces sp. GESEQ-35]